MKLPGSEIDIGLDSDFVILKDQQLSKRIPFKGKSFSDVLADVQSFAYIRGCRAPKKILKFILIRIGLPDVEVFAAEDTITKDDIAELAQMLNAINSLKDRFLSPMFSEKPSEEFVEILGVSQEIEEVAPKAAESHVSSIWDSDTDVEAVFKFFPENLSDLQTSIKKEIFVEREPVQYIWDTPAIDEVEAFDETVEDATSHLKIIMLGEKGVGKQSILVRAGFQKSTTEYDGDTMSSRPLAFSRIVEHVGEKTRVDAWSLEGAMEANIPKEDFYAQTGVLVLVYSVADRRSFESIEFWATEASCSFLTPPPVIIVGNKTDLRGATAGHHTDVEPPVSWQEGERLRSTIAEKLGAENCAHPVLFVECCCSTNEGIEDVVNSLLKIWHDNEKVVVPLIEPPA
ncbi:MAG: hypothetical protein ACW99U_04970 [Candidatus Thorarchaeota archaeon]|jgi:GTPase SAR1 family protein